ncbi:MAG: putative glycosyltransferase (group 1) [Candidatus Peregrinibacteria bacterium Gr01-1014_25]|nr:MAG: putative glycosyltransferase (group 1) [Candidatus Peregrinibacteria bacterium Gr01-1014_25]
MHITLLNDDVVGPDARGGVAVVVDQYRRGYTTAGHRVSLVTTHQNPSLGVEHRWSDAAGEVISLLVDVPVKGRHRRSVSRTDVEPRVLAAMRELMPDVVHAHNVHTYLTYRSFCAARAVTNRVFMTAQDTFLVSFARVGGPRYEAAALAGKPYRMHWWDHLRAVGREYYPPRNARIKRILRDCMTKVVVYSTAMEQFMHANGITNTAFIHHSVDDMPAIPDAEIRQFRERFRLTGPTVYFGGRLSGDKGMDSLLAAAERTIHEVPHAHVLIGGDTERLAPYFPRISQALKQQLVPTGWLSLDEFKMALAASDVVTVPSVYLDALATMNLWGMAAGKPVVGSIFGGAPDAIVDGETGYLVNPHDAAQFADRLTRLLKDPERAKAMGQAAKRRIDGHFSLREQIRKYLALFDGATMNRP